MSDSVIENAKLFAVRSAFSDVLKCPSVRDTDDFFALGGDSVKVLRLIEAILGRTGFPLSPEEIGTARTPEKIALLIDEDPRPSIHNDEIPAFIPLIDAQRGVYFECKEDPESTMYNAPYRLSLPAETDLERFEKAVISTALQHPALFVTIGIENGEPVMYPGSPDCSVVRCTADSPEDAAASFIRPFDLEKGPLFRFELCTLPKGTIFFLDIHHIVFDGSSIRILLKQITDAYNGQAPRAESLTIFDIAAHDVEIKETAAYKKAREFFNRQFEGQEFDAAVAPDVDSKRTARGCSTYSTVPGEIVSSDEVDRFCRSHNLTKSSFFMGAFAYTTAKFNNMKDSFFTTVNSGRHQKELSQTVGMFVKTFPMHFSIDEDQTVIDFLDNVQSTLYQSMVHDCISFGELAKAYGANLDTSFVYQADLLSEISLAGSRVLPELLPGNDWPSRLNFMVMKTDGGYMIRILFKSNRYSTALMENLAALYGSVVNGMLRCEHLGDIPLVSEAGRAFIDTVNATEKPFERNSTVNSVIDQVIAAYPDKTMLVYQDKSYSFTQFDRITRSIAAYISGKGIAADDFTAILVPRNDFMVLAAWGAIRAGASFQPLDPTYPPERLNYMVNDSKARLLIADRKLVPLLSEYHGDILYTDEVFTLPEAPDFHIDAAPESALTLIYTSGTTGKPKGCVLENRNLAAFFRNHREIMEMDDRTRMASYASFGFDAGVMDVVTIPMTGGTLYIIPDEIRLDLMKVEAFYRENGITHGFMTTQVGRMFAENTGCDTLRAFLVGGEKLVPVDPPDSFRFINGYGPCETMAYICSHEICDRSSVQPIGKPSGNTKLYVLDSRGRMLPAGAVGELGISGLQVGRGYLGLPEKTAEVFVPNPFCTLEGYERIYKTGDIVRLLPTGEFEYIGRRDGQVKIRGYRVELTEIEEVIRRCQGVKDAALAAFDDPAGGKYIAAYVVGAGTIDTEALKAFIRTEKPAYMVPAVIMQLDAIPYTQNQKVNRRALPLPEIRNTGEIVPPQNETQSLIFETAKKILGHDSFGIDTNLFDVGLTSVSTLKFNMELGKVFPQPIRMSDVISHNTIRALAELLGESNTVGEASREKASDYPLMQNQLGVFIECSMNTRSTQYNIPLLLKLSVRIDLGRLQDAVRSAVNAHPYMKTTLFTDKGGNVRAARHDEAEPLIRVQSVPVIPGEKDLIKPFDLLGGPLYRIVIFTCADGNYLFLDVHHIISDGTSIAILINDINKAYRGDRLEGEAFSGFEAAPEEEQLRASEKHASAEAYYDKLLAGCNTECLPAKCPEKTAAAGDCAHLYRLFEHCSAEITSYCETNRLTANAFFNAVFACTLSVFLHSDDVSYCTIYNGRNDSRLAESFAMLVKTLPVRCEVSGETAVCDFIRRMQDQLLNTMANDTVSFAEVRSRYGFNADLFFNYQGGEFSFNTIGGEKAVNIPLNGTEAKAPLSVEVFIEDGVYKADVTYRTDFFCQEFVSSFIDGLITAAAAFTRCEKVGQVSVLSDAEWKHFEELNATDMPFRNVPAQVLFAEQAVRDPDRIAVKTSAASVTFGELDRMANRIANALTKLGAAADEIIGLILERSELVPAVEFGIMKAGAAFLPMLPTYPDDRLEFCLENAESRFVIASKAIIDSRPDLFAETKKYRPLVLEDLLCESNESAPDVPFRPDQLAYCIYTSGSTGTPKGVMIEQHNLSGFIQTAGLLEAVRKGNTILCMASISFDMSITEMICSLCHGKTLYIASEEEIHDFDRLLTAFTENRVDIMMMTPSFAWSLLSLSGFESALAQLNSVVLGAEVFRPSLFGKLKELSPDMLIMNGYGPTECTQVCSAKVLIDGKNITIGKPFPNTKFFVRDINGNLLPRYAVGELLISGEGVGRGYVKLPEKTRDTFITVRGLRAYRSGDLVRLNRDNEIEFGGRADNQVKLRGFRVELDEIEAVMQEYDGVTQSKVIVRNNGTEDFLAGFFTADRPVDPDSLTAFMKTKLTYYMVPSALMQLEKMPMTPNGKLDKKALPEIRPRKKVGKKRAPKKSLEGKILDIFRSILGNDECTVEDNFFEIGGTSLSASKAVMQLKSDGYKVEYQDIFDHQSAEELAEYLESLHAPARETEAQPDESADIEQDPKLNEVLSRNTLKYAAEVTREPLGDVVLTGPTGFLGNHILKTLLEHETGHIYCIMRKGNFDNAVTRLQTMLVYYFEDDFAEAFNDRITVIEGDITDSTLRDKFRDISFDTLINCAASVKHYANDNSIEFVNVHGVENLIALCKEKHAKMIQISTSSVPGAHTDETYHRNIRMTEDRLFVIDDMNNQYVQSKYKAELLMLDAIRDGMRGKIIRVGNLMGRHSDGEFQTNMRTNAFLNGLRGFVAIGKCPISHCTDPISFSPVDCTALAVVILAGTNDCFTAFHAESRFSFDEMKLIDVINQCGIPVIPVSDEEYYADFYRMMGDPKQNEKVSALLTNDRPDMHMVETDNRFTANILYRLGFSWPFIDDTYLEKVIRSLDTLDFFSTN